MSRLPSAAASRNMSACSAQAMSQVGCRLMVASSANTSRPFAPSAWGDIARALATKAAMSSDADGLASGSEPALFVEDVTPADFDLVGSPDIRTRKWLHALCGAGSGSGQCALGSVARPSVLDRSVERNRSRFGDLGHVGLDRLQRAVVVEEFVEHALDGLLCLLGAGIAHVVMLEIGTHHRNPRLRANIVAGNDARIGLEHRILGTERQDLELAVGHERQEQIVEPHHLF